jgi:hypothetical protein
MDPQQFLQSNRRIAVSSIRSQLAILTDRERRRILTRSSRVVRGRSGDAAVREAASRVIIAFLPESMKIVQSILADCGTGRWYEVHFTMFCALDRDDFSKQDQLAIESLIAEYIQRARRKSGLAVWKAGDVLGDEWRNRRTITLLRDLIISSRYAVGRLAAAHGLAHALEASRGASSNRIQESLRKAARDDRSKEVRRTADYYLRKGSCL